MNPLLILLTPKAISLSSKAFGSTKRTSLLDKAESRDEAEEQDYAGFEFGEDDDEDDRISLSSRQSQQPTLFEELNDADSLAVLRSVLYQIGTCNFNEGEFEYDDDYSMASETDRRCSGGIRGRSMTPRSASRDNNINIATPTHVRQGILDTMFFGCGG